MYKYFHDTPMMDLTFGKLGTIVSSIKTKKGVSMTNLLNEMDLAYCDCCGNYVPTVDVDGDLLCAYEYAEYPDIATVVV